MTVALLSANLVNVALNWLLIDGNWGLPRLGVVGSAWSTVFARVYLAIFLLAILLRKECREPTGLFHWEGPDGARLKVLFLLGLPAAGHIFLEIAVFGAATALAGRFPPVALAAHEITLVHASLAFMVPLGISSAAAVRVGNAIGAGLESQARLAGNTAILVGAGFMALSGIVMYLFPRAVLRVYTIDRAVIEYAVPLLFWAAVFQLFDGVQVVATGALRGRGDTRAPFVAGLVGYWVLGLPIGAWLCFNAGYGVRGLWMGLSLGLAIVSVMLTWRWITRPLERERTRK